MTMHGEIPPFYAALTPSGGVVISRPYTGESMLLDGDELRKLRKALG